MATQVLLDSYTVPSGGVTSVTFSNISQAYADLKIVYSARDNNVSAEGMNFLFNGNRSTTLRRLLLIGGSVYSDTNIGNQQGEAGYVNASNSNSAIFSDTEIYIPNYTGSQVKTYSVESAVENNSTTTNLIGMLAGANSTTTSPITSITIASTSNTISQYSTFYLYGIETNTSAPSGSVTIGTATDNGDLSANVAFSGSVTNALTYVAISSPGNLQGTSATSPIKVSGLTQGQSYTFKVAGANTLGTGAYSASSNSVTSSLLTGNYEAIAAYTVPSGGVSTVSFGGIPQNYSHLQLRILAQSANSGTGSDALSFTINGNSMGAAHYLYGNGTSVYSGTMNGTVLNIPQNGTGSYGGSIVDIVDYSNSNKVKTIRALEGWSRAGAGEIAMMTNLYNTDSQPVTSISFNIASVNIAANSIFALYGIR